MSTSPASASTGFVAVLRREWQRLLADPWDLAMLTWLPLLTIALTAWVFSAGVARDLPVAVVDHDHSALSRELTRRLDAAPGLRVAKSTASEADGLAAMRQRRVVGLVVVPAGLDKRVQGGQGAEVQWFYNGQFQAHAGSMGREVRAVVSALSSQLETTAREQRGLATLPTHAQTEPIRLRLDTLFNDSANYEGFLVLGVVPALLQMFITLAAITAIGRELKVGSVPEWLGAAGGSWAAALAGKLALPLLAFALHALAFVAFFTGVRGWAIEGSAGMVLLGLLLLTLAHLGIGVLMVGATLSLRMALSAAAFFTAPAFAFCGQGFPLTSMPPLARAWAEVLPLTHYLQLQSRHWLAGAPAAYGVGDATALLAFVLLSGAAGTWLLKARALQPSSWGRA